MPVSRARVARSFGEEGLANVPALPPGTMPMLTKPLACAVVDRSGIPQQTVGGDHGEAGGQAAAHRIADPSGCGSFRGADLARLSQERPELKIARPHFYPFGGFDKRFGWLGSRQQGADH
jgi:hypothetical protein